ncbi:MAG: hypothetical protein UIM53_02825 [Acutalibacteraceae bacterium]|nr:hypothetical protein [Acutalibacteraceae bacterium]
MANNTKKKIAFSVNDIEALDESTVTCIFSVGDELYIADYNKDVDEIVYVGYEDMEKADFEVPDEVNDILGELQEYIVENID